MSKLCAKERNALPERQFAFPPQCKEPLENASHVRNAVARFNQVQRVSDGERDEAWARIVAASKQFGVDLQVAGWRELFVNSAETRRQPSARH